MTSVYLQIRSLQRKKEIEIENGVLQKVQEFFKQRYSFPISTNEIEGMRDSYKKQNNAENITAEKIHSFVTYLGNEMMGLSPSLERDLKSGKVAADLSFYVTGERLPVAAELIDLNSNWNNEPELEDIVGVGVDCISNRG